MICFVFKMIIPGLHRVGVGQVPNEDTRNAWTAPAVLQEQETVQLVLEKLAWRQREVGGFGMCFPGLLAGYASGLSVVFKWKKKINLPDRWTF
jgi:hypothetical protein